MSWINPWPAWIKFPFSMVHGRYVRLKATYDGIRRLHPHHRFWWCRWGTGGRWKDSAVCRTPRCLVYQLFFFTFCTLFSGRKRMIHHDWDGFLSRKTPNTIKEILHHLLKNKYESVVINLDIHPYASVQHFPSKKCLPNNMPPLTPDNSTSVTYQWSDLSQQHGFKKT